MDKDRQKKQEADFLRDVAQHQMQIIRDDGVSRHLQFKRPGTSCYYFDIITWPGKLCISGDCGTWVFARIHDMFDFFRTDENDFNFNRDGGLSINPGYWSEKLLAVDNNGRSRDSSPMEYSDELFQKAVADYVEQATDDWTSLHMLHVKEELIESIEFDIGQPESEQGAYQYINDFSYDYTDDDGKSRRFEFQDFFDYELRTWTYHFIWNLFAIAYAIREYDAAKRKAQAECHHQFDEKAPHPDHCLLCTQKKPILEIGH